MHHCSETCVHNVGRNPKAPDPKNFTILNVKVINGLTIVDINYAGVTNFEGNKILVFKTDMSIALYSIREIDPHFDGNNGIIARFIPGKEGWNMAECFCEAWGNPKIQYRGPIGDTK